MPSVRCDTRVGSAKNGTKQSRQNTPIRLNSGTTMRRGQRDTTAPKIGASSTMQTKVAP